MGAHGMELVASVVPVGGTIALVLVLAVGAFAVHLARKAATAREPIFPDLPATAEETEAFTHELAAAGTLDDDAAQFTDVANRSGVQQAYALLALVNGDAPAPRVTPDTSPLPVTDPFATLAQLDAPQPVSGAPIAAGHEITLPATGSEPRSSAAPVTNDVDLAPERIDLVDARVAAGVHPDDTLLPGRRPARRHGHAA